MQYPQQGQQGQATQSSDLDFFLYFCIFGAFIYALATFIPPFIGLHLLELNIKADALLEKLNTLTGFNLSFSLINYESYIPYVNGEVSFNIFDIEKLNARIFSPIFTPLAILIFGYYLFKLIKVNSSERKSKKRLKLSDLIPLQADYFKFMTPVAKTSIPDEHSLLEGIWARAQKPYEYIEEVLGLSKGADFNVPKIEKVLIHQLGVKINSMADIKKSNIHTRIMLVIMALKIIGKKEESFKLTDDVAQFWDIDKNDNVSYTNFFRGNLYRKSVKNKFIKPLIEFFVIADGKKIESVLSKYMEDKEVINSIDNLIKKHAYINTLLSGALEQARERSGRFTTPEFLWLKPTDRVMFYALNQVGRRECWIESLAVYNHFECEKKHGERIEKAQIISAITKIKSLAEEYGSNLVTEDGKEEEAFIDLYENL